MADERQTAAQVLADVDAGKVDAKTALEQEKASDQPRSTLVTQLEARVKASEDAATQEGGQQVAQAQTQDYETVTVRVNDKIKAYGGVFYDPGQDEGHRDIAGDPVAVKATPFVEEKLRSQELVRAK